MAKELGRKDTYAVLTEMGKEAVSAYVTASTEAGNAQNVGLARSVTARMLKHAERIEILAEVAVELGYSYQSYMETIHDIPAYKAATAS